MIIHFAVPRGASPYIICDTGETPRRVDAYNEKSVDMARDVIPAATLSYLSTHAHSWGDSSDGDTVSYGSYSEQYCEATVEETRRSSTNNSKAMTALLGTETFKLPVRPHFGHTSRSKLGPSARGKIDKDNPKELRIKLSARILFRGLSLRRGTTERTYPLSRLYRSPD